MKFEDLKPGDRFTCPDHNNYCELVVAGGSTHAVFNEYLRGVGTPDAALKGTALVVKGRFVSSWGPGTLVIVTADEYVRLLESPAPRWPELVEGDFFVFVDEEGEVNDDIGTCMRWKDGYSVLSGMIYGSGRQDVPVRRMTLVEEVPNA